MTDYETKALEVFLVHQDDTFAKVELSKAGGGWSVHVVDVRNAGGGVIRYGRAFAWPGSLEEARDAGIREARLQIAQVLCREPDEGGHVLLVANEEGAFETDGTKFLKPQIQVLSAGEVVYRLAMEPVADLATAGRDAASLARQLLRRVSKVRADGSIQI